MKGGKIIIMRSKKGQAGIIALIIGVFVVVSIVILGISQGWFFSQSALETEEIKAGLAPCGLDPTFSWSIVDSINPGTAVSGTGPLAIVNGVYKGNIYTTTKFSKGDKVQLLVNGTDYVSKILPETYTTDCGVNQVKATMDKLDGAPTISVFNSDGDKVTDSYNGGAINQSSSANPINMEIRMTVPSDEAIDSMVFVIEAKNSSEIDKITLSSSQASVEKYVQNKPEFHSLEGIGSNQMIRSFKVTDIEDDGMETSFNLLMEPESGATIGLTNQSIYVTWYVEQAFVDTDGTFKIGIENDDGTAKHVTAASSDYDFGIGVAA